MGAGAKVSGALRVMIVPLMRDHSARAGLLSAARARRGSASLRSRSQYLGVRHHVAGRGWTNTGGLNCGYKPPRSEPLCLCQMHHDIGLYAVGASDLVSSGLRL